MRRAPTAPRNADGRRPTWLTDVVGDAWGKAEWARWEQRVLPALEARGVTPEMLQPLYGADDGELLGIGVQAEVGWRVGWLLGNPRRRRVAVLRATSDLVRSLDAPNQNATRTTPAEPRCGAWYRSR